MKGRTPEYCDDGMNEDEWKKRSTVVGVWEGGCPCIWEHTVKSPEERAVNGQSWNAMEGVDDWNGGNGMIME